MFYQTSTNDTLFLSIENAPSRASKARPPGIDKKGFARRKRAHLAA